MGSYDKLGDMLNDVLKTGKIPEREKTVESEKKEEIKKEPQNEESVKNKGQEKEFSDKNSNKTNNKIDKGVYKFIHLYKLFNLNPDNCTLEDLKTSYRKLIKKYHPDNYDSRFPEMRKAAEKKTKELVEAYQVLSKLIS